MVILGGNARRHIFGRDPDEVPVPAGSNSQVIVIAPAKSGPLDSNSNRWDIIRSSTRSTNLPLTPSLSAELLPGVRTEASEIRVIEKAPPAEA